MPPETTRSLTPAAQRRETERAAHQARFNLIKQHAGGDLRDAVKVHWKDATFTTFEEALAELAQGIEVTMTCDDHPPGAFTRWPLHRLRLNPDGSVSVLQHEERIDLDTADLLGALGGHVPACLAASLILPNRLPLPAWLDAAKNALGVKVRALHTAVAWAQHPGFSAADWTPAFGDSHLRYGITPALVAEWSAAGWDPQTALPFQQVYADLTVADAWRAAGDTSKRAAVLAGRGEGPASDDTWGVAGFSRASAAPWRRTRLSAAEAWEYHRRGFTPTVAKVIAGHSTRPRGCPLTPAQVFAWVDAGVPARGVLDLAEATGADLDLALTWLATGVPSHAVGAHLRPWGGRQAMAPAEVKEWLEAGFPASLPHVMQEAAVHPLITPSGFAAALDGLRTGKDFRLLQLVLAHVADTERERQHREAAQAARRAEREAAAQ